MVARICFFANKCNVAKCKGIMSKSIKSRGHSKMTKCPLFCGMEGVHFSKQYIKFFNTFIYQFLLPKTHKSCLTLLRWIITVDLFVVLVSLFRLWHYANHILFDIIRSAEATMFSMSLLAFLQSQKLNARRCLFDELICMYYVDWLTLFIISISQGAYSLIENGGRYLLYRFLITCSIRRIIFIGQDEKVFRAALCPPFYFSSRQYYLGILM